MVKLTPCIGYNNYGMSITTMSIGWFNQFFGLPELQNFNPIFGVVFTILFLQCTAVKTRPKHTKRRKPRKFKLGVKERMKLANQKYEATIKKEKILTEKLLKENAILRRYML